MAKKKAKIKNVIYRVNGHEKLVPCSPPLADKEVADAIKRMNKIGKTKHEIKGDTLILTYTSRRM